MKTTFITGASKKGVDELRADPVIIRLRTLRTKVRSGKASRQELAEYNQMLDPVRAMKPGVLVD